jgi:hypothetical protein
MVNGSSRFRDILVNAYSKGGIVKGARLSVEDFRKCFRNGSAWATTGRRLVPMFKMEPHEGGGH